MEFCTPLLSWIALTIAVTSCSPSPVEKATTHTQESVENSLKDIKESCWVRWKKWKLMVIEQSEWEKIWFCMMNDGSIIGSGSIFTNTINQEII